MKRFLSIFSVLILFLLGSSINYSSVAVYEPHGYDFAPKSLRGGGVPDDFAQDVLDDPAEALKI